MPGLVLDPFAGNSTTIEIATSIGFSAVGVDIDPPEDLRGFTESKVIE